MTSRQERYDARKEAWIEKQLAVCPPLSDRQKVIIAAAFADARFADRRVA